MMKQKKQKVLLTGAVAAFCAMVMLAGTYAWTSISQFALNEVQGSINSGGRLHDDFDGKNNKDIYVENYTSAPGTDLIVRIRLREYLEFTTSSGNKTVYPTGSSKGDKSTWKLYGLPSDGLATNKKDENSDHFGYCQWTFGGQTVYMPTFNKDSEYNRKNESDLNGTSANTYSDYAPYAYGQALTLDADYGNGTMKEETHYADHTLSATVISMTEWENGGKQLGKYWIYDDSTDGDGWFYWGERLSSGSATGLLLDAIQMNLSDQDNVSVYYGIYVESQMVTPSEVEVLDDTSNTGGGGVSTRAEDLLEKLMEDTNGVSLMSDYELTQTEDSIRQAQIQEIYEKMLEEEAKEAEEREKTEEPTITDGDETEKPEEATSGDSTTDDGTEPPADTQPPMEAPSDSTDELPDDEKKDQMPEETPDSDFADTEGSAGVTISDGTQDTGSISKTLFGLFRHGVQ